MTTHENAYPAVLREEFSPFIEKCFCTVAAGQEFQENWHIESLAWHLQECERGRIKRLIITMPPRHLKSICASVALPAWLLGRDPTNRIICASYSQDLTRKHSLDCRTVMESSWYRQLFPKTRFHSKKNTEAEIMTTRQGFRLGASVGGTLTGRGGNFIIIDDPMKPSEAPSDTQRRQVAEWYDGTLYSRLDNKKDDVIILVMQRLHEDDLVAHVLEKDKWVHLNLPAIAPVDQQLRIDDEQVYLRGAGELLHPEREDDETLAQIKLNLGSFIFSAQYLQSPVPVEGNLIKREWFRRYSGNPLSMKFNEIIQSWDTAIETGEANDYSVCTTWGIREGCYYLIDVLRGRFDFPTLMRRVISEAQKYNANPVIIEAISSGLALSQTLRRQSSLNLIEIKPQQDKVTRASQHSIPIEVGRVFLPEEAAWLADFESEVLTFPKGRHDDQVDSMVQFLMWSERRHHQVPQLTCTLIGGGGTRIRDRYHQRTGMSVL